MAAAAVFLFGAAWASRVAPAAVRPVRFAPWYAPGAATCVPGYHLDVQAACDDPFDNSRLRLVCHEDGDDGSDAPCGCVCLRLLGDGGT